MAHKMILVDTSILIDHFRKTDKERTALMSIFREGYEYSISAITEYEIYTGALLGQVNYWKSFLVDTPVLSFDGTAAKAAIDINRELKRKRKLIEIADLFIAGTAIANSLPLATLNRKHFERIDGLTII
jgi:predicted nucleic acid-binding protein